MYSVIQANKALCYSQLKKLILSDFPFKLLFHQGSRINTKHSWTSWKGSWSGTHEHERPFAKIPALCKLLQMSLRILWNSLLMLVSLETVYIVIINILPNFILQFLVWVVIEQWANIACCIQNFVVASESNILIRFFEGNQIFITVLPFANQPNLRNFSFICFQNIFRTCVTPFEYDLSFRRICI